MARDVNADFDEMLFEQPVKQAPVHIGEHDRIIEPGNDALHLLVYADAVSPEPPVVMRVRNAIVVLGHEIGNVHPT